MTSAITGGCLCGEVRFEYSGQLGAAGLCHCADCRRCTGSAFNISVPMEVRGFRVIKGSAKGFTKTADSGHLLTRHFCPACGSPLYTSSPRHPDLVYAKAGALDEPAGITLAHQSWTRSAVPWRVIPPDLPSYETARIRPGQT